MNESNIEFAIAGDKLVRYIPCPGCGENVYKTDVIIDKEAFLKCLKEWTNLIDTNEKEDVRNCSNCGNLRHGQYGEYKCNLKIERDIDCQYYDKWIPQDK